MNQKSTDWITAMVKKRSNGSPPRIATQLRQHKLHSQRQWHWPVRCAAITLAGAVLLLALRPQSVYAATIVVDGNLVAINNDDQCSLIEAINNANDDAQTHTDCPAGSGADVIVLNNLAMTPYRINTPYVGFVGLPRISSTITIRGGATIERSVEGEPHNPPYFRIFRVQSGGNLTLDNITIRGGRASDSAGPGGGIYIDEGGRVVLRNESGVVDNFTTLRGGGIFNQGTLEVNNSTVSGNDASGQGGGILNEGTLTIVNGSRIGGEDEERNSADTGGGISSTSIGSRIASLTIEDSFIQNNFAESGGGLYTNSITTIERSEFSGNDGAFGGGAIFNEGSDASIVTIVDSTFRLNRTDTRGGAIRNDGNMEILVTQILENRADLGGGIFNEGELMIRDSTVSNNFGHAPYAFEGGGIHNTGEMEIVRSRIHENLGERGSGIFNEGELMVSDSTISFNSSRQFGEDLTPAPAEEGGGIHNSGQIDISGTTISNNWAINGGGVWSIGASGLSNTTVSGNVATDIDPLEDGHGAGIFIADDPASLMDLVHVTLSRNTSTGPGAGIFAEGGALIIEATIVSDNGSSFFEEYSEAYIAESASVVSQFNLLGHSRNRGVNHWPTDWTSITPTFPSDRILDPILRPNGGETWTHALFLQFYTCIFVACSRINPAIDFVPWSVCTGSPINLEDQRHEARTALFSEFTPETCDIGAFELQPMTLRVIPKGLPPGIEYLPCASCSIVQLSPQLTAIGTQYKWSVLFDGTLHGLSDGDAIQDMQIDEASLDIYMNFTHDVDLPNLPKVSPKDIVRFDGTGFSIALEGNQIGLDEVDESIDAFSLLAGSTGPSDESCSGYLLFSTNTDATVGDPQFEQLKLSGEDVARYCIPDTARSTAESWDLILDGSELGLAKDSLIGLSASSDGKLLYFKTDQPFTVGDLLGQPGLIYRYEVSSQMIDGPVFDPEMVGMGEGFNGLDMEGDFLVPFEQEPYYPVIIPMIQR